MHVARYLSYLPLAEAIWRREYVSLLTEVNLAFKVRIHSCNSLSVHADDWEES